MRIGNITLNGHFNFGNKLQLYALQQIMQKYGDVENIEWENYFIKRNRFSLKSLIKKIIVNLRIPVPSCFASIKRYKGFYDFSHKHIKTYKIKLKNKKTEDKINRHFDFFVAGSDQIWNPNFLDDNMYIAMLGFCPKEKRIAISPSMAIDNLTETQETEFKKYLPDYKYLSCREEQGAVLMSNLLNKEVVPLIDPTLMLGEDDWAKLAKKPKYHNDNKKYILAYFLGNITETYKYVLNTISKKYNLEIINLLDKNSKYYTCGPSEFIYLVKNCELMLTDSFHGSVFSYIYNKPFKIFVRKDSNKSMNSRLLSLINKLQLDNSVFFDFENGTNDLFNISYTKDALEKEQKIFLNYVEKTLGVNNE